MNTGVLPVVSFSSSFDHVFLEPKKILLGLHQDPHSVHFSVGFFGYCKYVVLVIVLGTVLAVFEPDAGLT